MRYQRHFYAVKHDLYFVAIFNSGAPAAEGRQTEPHTHIRELKGTYELIFSCLPWVGGYCSWARTHDDDDGGGGGVAQHGGHTPII